jgi:hypothetical protein
MSTGITGNNEIVRVEPEVTDLTVSQDVNASANQSMNQNSIGDTTSDPTSAEDWQRFQQNASRMLKNFSRYAGNFFAENKSLLTTLGWVVLTLISIKILLTLVDAINDIPLLPGLLELVGFGYTTWFVYRYMLNASSRQELGQRISQIKEDVFGDKAQHQLDQSLDRFQAESSKAQQELTQDLNRLEETIETELTNEMDTTSETATAMSSKQTPNSL